MVLRATRQPQDRGAGCSGEGDIEAGPAQQIAQPKALTQDDRREDPDRQERTAGAHAHQPDEEKGGGAGGQALDQLAVAALDQLGGAVVGELRSLVPHAAVTPAAANA